MINQQLQKLGIKKKAPEETQVQLYAFDSRKGNSEGTEKEKIFAYYPVNAKLEHQLTTVGITQALWTFTSTFENNTDFVSLETDENWWIAQSFEFDIWLGIVCNKNWSPGKFGPIACQNILKEIYGSIKLLYGSVSRLLDLDTTCRRVKTSLQNVLNTWGEIFNTKKSLETINAYTALGNFRMTSLPYLSLPKSSFFSMQHLTNLLYDLKNIDLNGNVVDMGVKGIMLWYDRFLLWSSFSLENTKLLYTYISITDCNREDVVSPHSERVMMAKDDGQSHPMWLTRLHKNAFHIFIVSVERDRKEMTMDTMSNEIRSLAVNITLSAVEQLTDVKMFHISGYRYACVDETSKIGYGSPPQKVKQLYKRSSKLLALAQQEFETPKLFGETGDKEIVLKSTSGSWILAKRVGNRLLYVAMDQLDDRNLEDIDRHVEKMCNNHFPGVFDM